MPNWLGRPHLDFIVKDFWVYVRCQSKCPDPVPTWCGGIGKIGVPRPGWTDEGKCKHCDLPFAVKAGSCGVEAFTPVQ